jgi:hypothetical protein
MIDGKRDRLVRGREKLEVGMKEIAWCLAALVTIACGATAAIAQGDNGCIRCHADSALMKYLFIPPKIDRGEGEG